MGIYTKGIYADYIKRVQSNKLDIEHAFDKDIRQTIRSEKSEAVIAFAAARLSNIYAHYAKHHDMPPRRKNDWIKMISYFSRAFYKINKFLISDLSEFEERNEIARNFLKNVIKYSELVESPYANFLLQLVDAYQVNSNERYKEFCNISAEKLAGDFDKKLLTTELSLYGEEVITDILLTCLRGVAYPQNVIVSFLNQNYPSNSAVPMSSLDLELKRIFERKVFNEVRLEKHEAACLLREYSMMITNTIQVIKSIVNAYERINEDALTKTERPELSMLMHPYVQIANMDNPFIVYDDQKASLKGLVTVQTTSGDKYVGVTQASQRASANEYVEIMRNKLTERFKSPQANKFADLLALCSSSYEALCQFIMQLKTKYNDTKKYHELSKLISMCDGSGESLAIKAVQNPPKLVLLLSDIYGKKSDEAVWMRKYVEQSDTMTYLQYVERITPEMKSYQPQIQRIKANLFQTYRDGSKKQLNAHLKSAVNSNDQEVYDELLKIVSTCRDYYSLDMQTSEKAKAVVINLDALYDVINQDPKLSLEIILRQISALRTEALKGTRNSGLFVTRHRDTYTQMLIQMNKLLEMKLKDEKPATDETPVASI